MKLLLRLFVLVGKTVLFRCQSQEWLVLSRYADEFYPDFVHMVTNVAEAQYQCTQLGSILLVLYNVTVKAFFRYYLKQNNRKFINLTFFKTLK